MIMGRCSWPIADVPPPHGIRDSERQRPVPLRLQAEYRAFAVESEFVDHVDPGSVPMIAEMAPLHRPRNDVGPKGGNAFAAGIAHRRIDDSICPAVTALASEDLRRRIIVRCEQGFEAPLRSDIEQIGPRSEETT